jgi:hypothetical protein
MISAGCQEGVRWQRSAGDRAERWSIVSAFFHKRTILKVVMDSHRFVDPSFFEANCNHVAGLCQ